MIAVKLLQSQQEISGKQKERCSCCSIVSKASNDVSEKGKE